VNGSWRHEIKTQNSLEKVSFKKINKLLNKKIKMNSFFKTENYLCFKPFDDGNYISHDYNVHFLINDKVSKSELTFKNSVIAKSMTCELRNYYVLLLNQIRKELRRMK
jgi:hypothetical protein